MPLQLSTLGIDSLKQLALDLSVPAEGKTKTEILILLNSEFVAKGYDVDDVSSIRPMDSKAEMQHPPTVPLQLPPPAHFDVCDRDREKRWALWLDDFETYLNAIGHIGSSQKTSLLLYCAGPALKRMIDKEYKSYQELLDILDQKFLSKGTTSFNRFKLGEMKQAISESTDDYISRLRLQARFCKFKCNACGSSTEDDRLFEIVLRNTAMPELRTRIFEKGLTKIAELLETARNLEIAKSQSNQMKSIDNKTVNEISVVEEYRGKRHPPKYSGQKKSVDRSQGSQTIRCMYCDRRHALDKTQCPAVGKKCSNCGTDGHFALCCKRNRFVRKDSKRHDHSKINHTECLGNSTAKAVIPDDKDFVYFGSMVNQAFVNLKVDGEMRKFLLDTGASKNLIPKGFVKADVKLEPCGTVMCYSGTIIKPLGLISLPVEHNRRIEHIQFLVVQEGQPLLGLRECLKLGFVTLNDEVVNNVASEEHQHPTIKKLLDDFSELFGSDLGCVKGVKAVIQALPTCTPRFMRNRSVPLALRSKVIETIDSMIERGTVTPVKTSKWASPLVIVPKPDGSLRLCADYTATLNPQIDTEAYPLPHPEELFSALSGKKIFTKLDLRMCFEQFELDDASKPLLTINTIRGLLQYQRLPYGISSAPAIVQRAMEEILNDLNVQVYLDDILIASENMESHLITLKKVFTRFREANIRLRQDKCIFAVPKVLYLGFIVSESGRSADPEKTKAIKQFPVPSTIKELRSFLGLVRFYDKFIPALCDLAKPLHNLLKKNAPWIWSNIEHEAYRKIKQTLCSSSCLQHYDPLKPIIIATDASPYGVSAVLSHRDEVGHEYPIAYASRTLSPTETRYAQIDREALAIIYGVRKFNKFVLGRHFTLITDHKPLQSIFGNKKGLPALTTARLHRYAIFLLSYSFDVEYRTGPENCNADALSRAPVDQPVQEMDETENFMIHNLESAPLNSDTLITETASDPILTRILQYVRNGWPSHCSDVVIKPFWNRRGELSVHGDLLLWGQRVVVPDSMQSSVLEELHCSHSGIVKMKSLARLHVWWTSLNMDIETFVQACNQCQLNAALPSMVNVKPWPAADIWERVHLDFATIHGRNLLLLIDAGSKWIEAKFVTSTTSSATLETLYYWFTRFGFPRRIHTDGGPQFTSQEFKGKILDWGIELSTSTPYHPESNGLAERAVRFIKEAMKKAIPLNQILFMYRATPITEVDTSPAELFFKRRLRTRLSALRPRSGNTALENVPTRYTKGDLLWVRDFRPRQPKWQEAVCLKDVHGSVVVAESAEEVILRRHLNHVRKRRKST